MTVGFFVLVGKGLTLANAQDLARDISHIGHISPIGPMYVYSADAANPCQISLAPA